MNMNIFNFQGQGVRTITINGEPWFVASDVARILGYANPQKAIRDHCKGVNETVTPSEGGPQVTKIIRENDVYRLILRSNMPSAQAFESWVMDEVLPSIRKTGQYGGFNIPKTLGEALTLAGQLEHQRAALAMEVKSLQEDVQVLEPKAAFHDAVSRSEDTHDLGEAARLLGTGRQRLVNFLLDKRYLMRHRSGLLPYQDRVDAGLFRVVEVVYEDAHHQDRLSAKTLVTGKGLIHLQKLLRPGGSLIRPQHTGRG